LGFIGSVLGESFIHNGHSVRVDDNLAYAYARIDHEQLEFIEASTTDSTAMEKAFDGVDASLHLAGATTDNDPRRDGAGQNASIDEYAKSFLTSDHSAGNVPVVYASSAAVYTAQPPGRIPETASKHPVNAHGEEKLMLETAAHEAHAAFATPSVGLRFFNLYGPTQSPTSIYCGAPRRFIELIRTGQPIPLYGGGRQIRDFTYIDDAIASLQRAVRVATNGAQIFNICTGTGTSIRELGETIERALGRSIIFQDKPLGSTEVETSVGDPTKAQTTLGFTAQLSLSQGVEKMLQALL